MLLTGGEEDCRFIANQRVVRVRVCTWSDNLNSSSDWWPGLDQSRSVDRIWFNRLHFFDKILQARSKIGLLMTDTDVCYYGNPFPFLESLNKSVVLNGNPDGLNIGLIYARKYKFSPSDTFDLFKEVARRMKSFRLAGINSTIVSKRNSRVYWDQNIVNDVVQQFVTGEPTYFRSCWIGFGDLGYNSTCFADCCNSPHPFGLKPGAREEENSMAWYIHRTLVPLFVLGSHVKPAMTSFKTRPEIAVTNLGGCGNPSVPLEHENQCRNISFPTKLAWMKGKNCWYEALDALPESL